MAQQQDRPGGGGGDGRGDFSPGTGLPRIPAGVASDALYGILIGGILGFFFGGIDGALGGVIVGGVVGGVVGGIENGVFDGDGEACFTGDTTVLMADGSKRNIDAIVAGDLVMARDEKTGATAPHPVLKTFHHSVDTTLSLHLEGGEVIETTAAHRFATPGRGFVGAGRLRPGNRLSAMDDAGTILLAAVSRSDRSSVYNLAVRDFHTYFVGNAELWVHNKKDAREPDTP